MFFFFNDTATTEIYTLSLHDALPICDVHALRGAWGRGPDGDGSAPGVVCQRHAPRSEEHTSELQSRLHLVCRLLLEKKKQCTVRRHVDDRLAEEPSLRRHARAFANRC